MTLSLFPPLLSETRRPACLYRTCSIARSLARTIVTCSTTAAGRLGRVGPALAGRPRAASRGDGAPWQRRPGRQLRLDRTCLGMY